MEKIVFKILRRKIGAILAIMGLGLFFGNLGIMFVPTLASLFVVMLMLDGGADVSCHWGSSRLRVARTF